MTQDGFALALENLLPAGADTQLLADLQLLLDVPSAEQVRPTADVLQKLRFSGITGMAIPS